MVLVGDVADKVAILVDDMAANPVKDHGAREVIAIDIPNESCLSQIVVTNTIPLNDKVDKCDILRVIDVNPTFAEGTRRTHNRQIVRHTAFYTPPSHANVLTNETAVSCSTMLLPNWLRNMWTVRFGRSQRGQSDLKIAVDEIRLW